MEKLKNIAILIAVDLIKISIGTLILLVYLDNTTNIEFNYEKLFGVNSIVAAACIYIMCTVLERIFDMISISCGFSKGDE